MKSVWEVFLILVRISLQTIASSVKQFPSGKDVLHREKKQFGKAWTNMMLTAKLTQTTVKLLWVHSISAFSLVPNRFVMTHKTLFEQPILKLCQ